MRRIVLGVTIWVMSAGFALAQTGLEDISGLPSGDSLAITDTTITNDAPVTAEPAPAAAATTDTGPTSVVVVVGAAAVIGYLLLKSRPSRARYRL